MKFYKNLYLGDTIKKPDKIKRKLKRHKKTPKLFVVVYTEETNQLEIYNSLFLLQWYYKENPPYIIGIANSQKEAVDIVRRIAEETVEKTGKADLIAYLFPRAMSQAL